MNSVVDEAPQRAGPATFRNPQGQLRPGMFVEVHASSGRGRSVIVLPASAVKLCALRQFGVRRGRVKGPRAGPTAAWSKIRAIGPGRGDQVSVVSGLKPGEEVGDLGRVQLRTGTAILVNNKSRRPTNPSPSRRTAE